MTNDTYTMIKILLVIGLILIPFATLGQVNTLSTGAGTAGNSTLTTGTIEAKQFGDWNGTYQNTGINLFSARQHGDGFLIRVKRLIKPGSDAAKEFATNIPVVSTAANILTLGIFKRVLKQDGEAVRATWLTMDCKSKSFNVAGDGYSWQNVYKDQYGQAEDLFYTFCVSAKPEIKPRYLELQPADADMLNAAEIGK